MSTDPSDNDLIERRILGKLTEAEIRSFDARVADDREFRRKYRLITTFPEMMSNEAKLELEERKLAAARAAAPPVVEKKPLRLPKARILVWGGVSLIAVTGIVLFFIFRNTDKGDENTSVGENVVHDTNLVKPAVVPVKDTTTVKQETVQQHPREVKPVSGQKAIALIDPAEGLNISRKETIVFKWEMKTDSFTRFYIFSQKSNQVVFWRGVRLGVREYKVPGNYFYPGKYTWYVGTKEDKRTFVISE